MTSTLPDLAPMPSVGTVTPGSNPYAGDGTRADIAARRNPNYQENLLAAVRLYNEALNGNRYQVLKFQEALTTSDFQILFADILQRQALGMYQEWPSTWDRLFRRGVRNDFRVGRAYQLDGAQSTLSAVKELDEYPDTTVADSKYEYAVTKFGRRFEISWESLVNDDLGLLRSAPERLASAARQTENRFATTLYAQSTGPNSTFFASGNANVLAANNALSSGSLQAAMTLLLTQKDKDGNPIFPGKMRLVVPPQLQITAYNILHASAIRIPETGNAQTGNALYAQNWTSQLVAEPVVDPWLPIISTTNGATSWYMFAEPGIGRPAGEVGFLRGNEAPALFVKDPNARRVGGGGVNPEDGDFDTDSIQWKVRHIFGGTLMEPRAAVASNGTGAAL